LAIVSCEVVHGCVGALIAGAVGGSLDDAEVAVNFSKVGLKIWPVLGVDGAAAPVATGVRVQASLGKQ
jgi:hypothetical protein